MYLYALLLQIRATLNTLFQNVGTQKVIQNKLKSKLIVLHVFKFKKWKKVIDTVVKPWSINTPVRNNSPDLHFK